jgi:anthranilate synthase component 1
MRYKLQTHYKKILADTITPVSIYLKIRDKYPNSILLESSDYRANDNTFSYICCNPIASIKIIDEKIIEKFPDGTELQLNIDGDTDVASIIHEFAQKFEVTKKDFKFINNGLFGYISYDAVRYFEDISITKKEGALKIPDIYYAVYQNIIAINHFKNEAYLFAHCYDQESNIEFIEQLLNTRNFASYNFTKNGAPVSNLQDEEYKEQVLLAKEHCHRGDVFQLVLSRRFSQKFKGDEFNVYRALRSVNPSPYLFYFDYGDFKIFGSSPEAQLIVNKGKAEIHPIVARNDLSRNGNMVQVENYREVQYFSHVIHLVSKVTGQKKADIPTFKVVADTFPAGTLSGAPKHMAMQLIEKYETINRDYYGGAIGFMDFHGNFNHAIMIRTFLSKNHELHYQAGAGIVAASNPENELQETYNKLGALTKALEIAEAL